MLVSLFSFHHAKNYLASLSFLMRWTFTILLVLSCMGVWYLLIYYPLHERIMKVHAQLEGLYAASGSDEQCQQLIQQKEYDFSSAQKFVALCSATQHSSLWLQEQINLMLLYISGAGLALTSCSVQSNQPKKLRTNYQIRLLMQGTLVQLQGFFEKIIAVKQLWSCKKISLTATNTNRYIIDATLSFCMILPVNQIQ